MIILTGYNGFIGKAFASVLDPDNIYRVEAEGAFQFLEEYEKWDTVDLIIHQGAISSTTETDLNKIHKYNVEFSVELFKKAIEYQIPVKYASSASVYGQMEQIINPLNYYALSKVAVDYWVMDHINEFKSVQGFRYFNVYGEGEEHKGNQASPVSKFTKQVQETGTIKLFENSDMYFRDFICVEDVVAIVLSNQKGSGIYDLGTSNAVTFQDVAELVATKYNGKIEHVPFPEHLRGKYQEFTSALPIWGDYKFITVRDYINADKRGANALQVASVAP